LRGSRTREKRLDTCQALFLRLAIRADDHDGLAKLLHALHHVARAWGLPIPERHQQVACLGELVVTPHASAFPKARPVRGEAARAHVMPHGPAKAELIRTAGAAGDDLGDAVALRCQRLAQELIVGERA
jgi:hypothetical protein